MRPDRFPSVNQSMKQALMMLAVDPRLKGVIAASSGGLASDEAAKFYQAILPDDSPHTVKVPLNVTEDRLLGSIDIERAVATGERQTSRGLLAEADRGALSVDNINLLDMSMISYIADALDSAVVRLEREGISELHQSRFVLISAFDKSEVGLNPILRERVGLIVESDESASAEERMAMLEHEVFAENQVSGFGNQYLIDTDAVRLTVKKARKRLSSVRISPEKIRSLIEAGLRLGIEGNRADILALRAARASAALGDRRAVAEEDLISAIRFVLAPRANRFPEVEESRSPQPEPESRAQENQNDQGASDSEKSLEELIIEATDARLPDNVLNITQRKSRNSSSGKRIDSSISSRGRYSGSTTTRPRESKVAIEATLRAAAPFQAARQAIRADMRVKIIPDDLRYKRFKRKTGMLFIFCVDASGSMAANRMAQAKGALTRLLQDAYLHRDRVALIIFRGEKAELLLAPTRSVELGKRMVDALPAGGGTPLASGLLAALELARLSRSKERENAMLVLFTDGRANVGLHTDNIIGRDARMAAIEEELKQIGAAMWAEGISSVVIDTMSRFLSGGEGRSLAEWLGGRYIYLPRANADSIYDVVASTATRARTQRISFD